MERQEARMGKPEEHEYTGEEKTQFVLNGVAQLTSFHSVWTVVQNGAPYAIGAYGAARAALAKPAFTTLGTIKPAEETVVIGKVNWIQNSSRLRQAMSEGGQFAMPQRVTLGAIRDSYERRGIFFRTTAGLCKGNTRCAQGDRRIK